MLGLERGPDGFRTNPAFPAGIGRIELNGGSNGRSASTVGPAPTKVDVPIAPSNGHAYPIGAADIFDRLEDLLDAEKTRGDRATYRFEIVGAGAWAFAVDDGTITRLPADQPVDCVVRMNEETFIGINVGEGNAMTAFLRGAMGFEGDLLLVNKLSKYIR
jgi:hypothetical protein